MPKVKEKNSHEAQSGALTKEERKELLELTQQRAATYGFLSRLYRREIDQVLLDEIMEMRFPASTGNTNVDKGYLLIVTFLGKVWENSITELAIDYSKTFIGHGVDAFSAAYPFESVYTSEKRLLMQDARDEVLEIFRKAGLVKQTGWKESEDHISVEMEYIIILCNRTIEALEKGDEDKAFDLLMNQRKFLIDHLIAWTPMLTIDIKRLAKTDFYKGLAWLTDGFLETDLQFLTDILCED